MTNRPRLITVPFSHYCEKARWALDRARVDYVEEGHVPGFHRLASARAGSARKSVPVLVTSDAVLCDSSDILAWADTKTTPDRALYPKGEAARREVIALEERFDEELGPHLRRILYFYILDTPRLAFQLMDPNTPLWQRAALRVSFRSLFKVMRRFMKITPRTAADSHARVLALLDDVDRMLADGRAFLVGDSFTAADLTLAALAAPAISPEGHPTRFPDGASFGGEAAKLLHDLAERPVAAYVRRIYREFRAV